jgi:hypothetical protein
MDYALLGLALINVLGVPSQIYARFTIAGTAQCKSIRIFILCLFTKQICCTAPQACCVLSLTNSGAQEPLQ